MAKELTPKEEAFAQAYVRKESATEAYAEVYNTGNMAKRTISNKASIVLRKDKIQARIKELRGAVAGRVKETLCIDRESVIAQLRQIAQLAMAGSPITDRNGNTVGYRPDFMAAVKATELIGRDLGMWEDKKAPGPAVAVQINNAPSADWDAIFNKVGLIGG